MTISYKIYFKAHQAALINTAPAMLKNWKIIFITFFASLGLKMQFSQIPLNDQLNNFISQPMVASFLIGFLQTFVIFFTISPRFHQLTHKNDSLNLWAFTQEKIGPFIFEMTKMSTYVTLWSFLFIIPGLFKANRTIFVPFIVLFESYKNNTNDLTPIQRSHQISKGLMWFLFPTLIFLNLLDGQWRYYQNPSPQLFPLALSNLGLITLWCYGTGLYYYMYHFQTSEQQTPPSQMTQHSTKAPALP